MNPLLWPLVILLGLVVAIAAAVLRHAGGGMGHTVPGGILVRNAAGYDVLTGLLLGPLYTSIADDIAAAATRDARILEVGSGPGHLAIRLARRGLAVTGIDLDPAMVERARANAEPTGSREERHPSFEVGDVAALPFPDASFDVVVSSLSLHHWAHPGAGLAEIARVLRPGGRALIWDFRPGTRPHLLGPRHAHVPDPVEHARGSGLHVVSVTPWRWPWRFTFLHRIELVRPTGT